MFAETLAPFLADFGATATWRSLSVWTFDSGALSLDSATVTLDGAASAPVTALVILDVRDEEIASRRAVSRDYRMLFLAATFPGIKYGDPVSIGSFSYTVLAVESIDDGTFYEAQLQRN